MELTPKAIDHLALLARLALSAEEKALFTGQLNKIVAAVETINRLDIAGVPVATVYRLFSSKLGVLTTLLDVSIAGDSVDQPVADRPAVRRLLADPDPARRIAGFASLVADINARGGPLYRMLVGAADSDEGAAALLAKLAQQRQRGQLTLVRSLAPGALLRDVDAAFDLRRPARKAGPHERRGVADLDCADPIPAGERLRGRCRRNLHGGWRHGGGRKQQRRGAHPGHRNRHGTPRRRVKSSIRRTGEASPRDQGPASSTTRAPLKLSIVTWAAPLPNRAVKIEARRSLTVCGSGDLKAPPTVATDTVAFTAVVLRRKTEPECAISE